MNFQKLHINTNNFNFDKCLDLQFPNEQNNNEVNNLESTYLNMIIKNQIDPNLFSLNPQNFLELYTKNNTNNQIEYTRINPFQENDSLLLNYGKKLNNLINISNNLLLKKKKREKKEKKKTKNHIHTKFATDNLYRKCRSLVLNYTLEYLNYQIKKIYEGNIGNGINIKKLLDINQEQKSQNTIKEFNDLKNKTLKEIFSSIISTKYTSYLPNHNELIIHKALMDKDENKRKKFTKLFNLTFADCIQKFLGNDNSEDSEGFQLFDNIKYKLKETNEYIIKIKEALIKFGKKKEHFKRKIKKIKK
jgi:hypothetical protein